VKINGEPMVECDYSCLHPNIAISIYGGSDGYLTHENVGNSLGLPKATIKTEHLSFFNKRVRGMKRSPLYDHYQQYEPLMLRNIVEEKQNNFYKHKITSRKLFSKEVEIMTAVVRQLNTEGIYVGYVYDALLCHPNHAGRVTEIMNAVAVDYGIMTTAKNSLE
jgi:hypothetical protein